MNPIDIEKYKKDMMKLYKKRVPSEDVEIEKEPERTEEPEQIPENEDEQIIEVEQEKEYISETEQSDSISERFPEPDLSELVPEYAVSEYVSQESMGDSTGYIVVNVRAGRGAYPIENASVVVTAIADGNRLIIASALTDISGTTIKIKAPAPALIYSQSPDSKIRPYSLFDISVRAKGYFNARSVDVPVFSGITSIQNFNMIPAPLGMKTDDETLTYFNQEPNL